jgi:CBS domain-containing protein
MRENDVSSLAVLQDERLVGIVTERDIVSSVAEGADPETEIAGYMTQEPATAHPDEIVGVVVERMLNLGVRHLPVVRNGAVVGMISARDLLTLEVLSTS